ncbi:50S ribosomal protein L17 [Tropheryma whipplei]|uniref:Large ribosomal subunit protein bL17 n=1 Tax=Tropheryma whipplei (strain Twist) TaxID=203267 RepID=RL17_TROWT|nr:50S ribosomal protein L17 [Tropheryma whipplei]Q83G10.1 RecName: Full=Large ribosomal subunit protein bL17; AltName: Full=50S ribosomal protein L17 [Tropheryma whipplei str. Twist]AAO44624.1 50S ribosomal protein L17 [Tropheryma whipplei str. Twist]
MPKPSRGPRMCSGPDHERLVLANMSASLFLNKKLRTTEARAKRLRPFAEKLVTLSKRGGLHSRRRALSILRNKAALHELFTNIAPLVEDRNGGYTRITKVGFRSGDGAPMALIELILEPVSARTRGTDTLPDTVTDTGPDSAPDPVPGSEPGSAAGDLPDADTAPADPGESSSNQRVIR